MVLHRLNTSYEFLRSDQVVDRVEFIKWAVTTDDDAGLLVAILERMAELCRDGDVDSVFSVRPRTPVVDSTRQKHLLVSMTAVLSDLINEALSFRVNQVYQDFSWGKLDPVRFVRVCKLLKGLEGHQFNIHEAAALERISEPRVLTAVFQPSEAQAEIDKMVEEDDAMIDWTILNVFLSFFSVVTQIVFIAFIGIETYDALKERFESEDVDVSLWVSNSIIAFTTITVFMGYVGENYVGTARFNYVFQTLRVRRAEALGERLRRDFCVFMNLVGNGVLGYLLFYLNIPFVVSAESITEAVLNSLATVFLLEVDDRVKPLQPAKKFGWAMLDWDDDSPAQNLVELANDYLYYKRDFRKSDEVHVQKIYKTYNETGEREVRRAFSGTDYCIIFVDDWVDDCSEPQVTIFRLINERLFPPVYEEIEYRITGTGAKEFVNNLQSFKRIQRDTSESINPHCRKSNMRVVGQRRTRSIVGKLSDEAIDDTTTRRTTGGGPGKSVIEAFDSRLFATPEYIDPEVRSQG